MDYQEELQIIYVISSPWQSKNNLYMIGWYSGAVIKLLKHYSLAIPNIMLYFSYDVTINKARRIEESIHKELDKYRLYKNGTTNWFQVNLADIIRVIMDTCQDKGPSSESRFPLSEGKDIVIDDDYINTIT